MYTLPISFINLRVGSTATFMKKKKSMDIKYALFYSDTSSYTALPITNKTNKRYKINKETDECHSHFKHINLNQNCNE